MNQRQKIIAIAIAVPVLALVAYAATSDNATPVVAAVTPTATPPAPAATATPTPAPDAGKVAGNGPKGNQQKKKVTLALLKERFTKNLAHATTMTEEDYATLRKQHPSLPPTLTAYRERVKKNADRVNAMTDADFQALQAKRAAARGAKHAPGAKPIRGVKVQEATQSPAGAPPTDGVAATPVAPPAAAPAPAAAQ